MKKSIFVFLVTMHCIIPVDFDVSMKKEMYVSVLERRTFSRWYTHMKKIYKKNKLENVVKQNELKIPKIFHYIWFGSPVPEEYARFRESWWYHHPDWTFIFWTDRTQTGDYDRSLKTTAEIKQALHNPIPGKRYLIDIKNLKLINQDFFDMAPNYGEQSDIIKWEVVYRFGGVYIDTDLECLRPLDDLHYMYDFYTGIQPLDTCMVQLGAAIFAAIPYHPILDFCVNKIKGNQSIYQIVLKTGPIHFTRQFMDQANKYDFIDVALPASYFYPCDYEQRGQHKSVWYKPEAFAVHHWASSWLKPEAMRRT